MTEKLPGPTDLPVYPSNQARALAADVETAMSEEHYGEEKSYVLAQYFDFAIGLGKALSRT